jgi:hypothetical protein
MGKEINQYPVTAGTVEDGSWFDIDQDIGGGNFQSQKLSKAIMQVALGTFYCADGQLKESRQVDLDGKTLQFINGQTSFGRAPTLMALAGAATILNVDFNTGNYQTIDLENATDNVTLTLTNVLIGGMYTIKIIQGAGLWNIIWPTTVKWASSQPLIVTTIDDAEDRVNLIFDNPNYHAVFASDFN